MVQFSLHLRQDYNIYDRNCKNIWVVLIIIYYIVATVLPVDKVIGKIYPIFGASLLFMAIGLAGAMIIGHFNGSMVMPEMTLQNLHPSGLSIFPFLFTTIACGALSGFHSDTITYDGKMYK